MTNLKHNIVHVCIVIYKIENIQRDIRVEESGEIMTSLRKLILTIGAYSSPKQGAEACVRKGNCSMLACHNRCNCSMKTTSNSVKSKLVYQGHEMGEKSDRLRSLCFWTRVRIS